MKLSSSILGLGVVLSTACGNEGGTLVEDAAIPLLDAAAPSIDASDVSGWNWNLPPSIPAPQVPEDNPMTQAKVDLGRHIFYDKRLSGNGTQACAGCHLQERGFAEDRELSLGSTGDTVPRNSPGLQNIAYNSTYTWLNPNFLTLESQMPNPIFGEFPVELGVTGNEELVLERFRSDATYQQLFAAAYPGVADPFHFDFLIKATASFMRSMVSFESSFDREVYWGDEGALSDEAKRGFELTQTERLDCFHCHAGFQFALGTAHENTVFIERGYFNTGLYNIGGSGDYPADSQGLFEFTGSFGDKGKFRAQTFRNIMLTGPYMHDGSVATIDDVIDIYARGGRNVVEGPNIGDGRDSFLKNEFVHGFEITETERAELKAFFESLTDESFVADPQFSDPWEK